MKRVLVCLLLALSLCLSLALCAHAEPQLDHVTDAANLLTDSQRQTLEDKAARLSEQYDCGIYIVLVDDYRDYVKGGIEAFAEEVFDAYNLGYGETGDGVMLAMSMNERDYDLYAHGDFGNYAFTDYGKGQLADSFLDNFRRNDWAGGFSDFVENAGDFLRRAKNGDPVDIWIPDPVEEEPGLTPGKLLISVLVGCLTGGVTLGGMKSKMKTAVRQTRAADYIGRGGVKLSRREDRFVNQTVTRQVIRRDPPSSGGRSGGHYGGTTISGSHGGSHHSGKF